MGSIGRWASAVNVLIIVYSISNYIAHIGTVFLLLLSFVLYFLVLFSSSATQECSNRITCHYDAARVAVTVDDEVAAEDEDGERSEDIENEENEDVKTESQSAAAATVVSDSAAAASDKTVIDAETSQPSTSAAAAAAAADPESTVTTCIIFHQTFYSFLVNFSDIYYVAWSAIGWCLERHLPVQTCVWLPRSPQLIHIHHCLYAVL